MSNAGVRSESNPPVFGAERDRVKAESALAYHQNAWLAAIQGLENTQAKRARVLAQLDAQVAQAEVEAARAADELEAARIRLADLKET